MNVCATLLDMATGTSIQVPIDLLTGIGVPLLSITGAVISSFITSKVNQARHDEQIQFLKESHQRELQELKEWIRSVESSVKRVEDWIIDGKGKSK